MVNDPDEGYLMKKLAGVITLTFSLNAYADCPDKVQACLEEGSSCSNFHPTGTTCIKQSKACILRIDECEKDYKSYLVKVLDCAEKGYTFEQCRKRVKMKGVTEESR